MMVFNPAVASAVAFSPIACVLWPGSKTKASNTAIMLSRLYPSAGTLR